MSLETFALINNIASALTLVAFLLCLYKFPLRNLEVRILALNCLASITVVFVILVFNIHGPPINIPQNINIIPMILLTLFMYDSAWKARYRKVTIASTVLFCLFAAWNVMFGQRASFNSYTIAFGSVFVIIHCVLYYYYLLVNLPVENLGKLPMFWINAGHLTYYAGSLFILNAYVVEVFRDSLLLSWSIQNFLRIVQFILIIVGLWQDLRNIRLRSSLPLAR